MNYNKTTTGETQDNTEGNDVCYKKRKLLTIYKVQHIVGARICICSHHSFHVISFL